MKILLLPLLALFSFEAAAQGLPLVSAIDNAGQSTRYSASLELVALMTLLTVLPSLLLMMTPFVRIIIVMSLLRQALGTGQTPPNQVLVGLALFNHAVACASALHAPVAQGVFGADMKVSLTNDGPVTFWLQVGA